MLADIFFMNILHFLTEVADIFVEGFEQGFDVFLVGFGELGTLLIENFICQVLEFFVHLFGQFFLLRHL